MSVQPIMVVSDTGALPEYPIPRGERLASHSFFNLHYDRFLNSRLYLLADWDVKGIAIALFCRAQDQDPVGTLPNDPREIAAMLNMSTDDWQGYCRRDPSPLHNWTPCLVGNRVHLMHPVVTEVAQAAFEQRVKGADRSDADKERQQLKRLKGNVAKLAGERFSENEMYLAQLDAWLTEHYPQGNRTVPRILKGMEALGTQF
ncbi:hypothetical protein [uncultured Roseobacter sp.]|uniref:hypothetical protein n=1 Tax=uncultured Roseobacter sp. TaxID=114847 RepID=UPI00262D5322|nr:hypothetical protein [uncultured Roseobacter sp.]